METLQFSVCPVPRMTMFSLACLVNDYDLCEVISVTVISDI